MSIESVMPSNHLKLCHPLLLLLSIFPSCWLKKCTAWELRVKLYLGKNENCSLRDCTSDSFEKLLQRAKEKGQYVHDFGKWVFVLSPFSRVWLFVTLRTVACQAPLSMGLSRQEYWSGLPCPSPGDLPDPGTKLLSLTSPALAGRFFATSTTWEALVKGENVQSSIYLFV